jgi:aspartate racemase
MHKKIGIVGGLTPESTMLYYQHIIRTYEDRFHDYAFPEIVINSVSFQKYVDWLNTDQWDKISDGIIEAIQSLHQAGADFAIIATNTPHKIFDRAEQASPVPLLHILEPTVKAIHQADLKCVAILGTKFTMQDGFYQDYLKSCGIQSVTPPLDKQEEINRIIFDELGKALITDTSKSFLNQVCDGLIKQGAQGIILGCTELPLILDPKDFDAPLFNTATLHAEAALEMAIECDSSYKKGDAPNRTSPDDQ